MENEEIVINPKSMSGNGGNGIEPQFFDIEISDSEF